jgi:glycine betaine/choline ABC-type transport system substrate-binding protein
MARRSAIVAAVLALAIACTACTAGSPRGSPPEPVSAGNAGPGVITVGSFDFPESVVLAYLYAGALSARGYPARVLPDLGSRELVEPALMTGLVQLVPEYTGSALEFVSLARAAPGLVFGGSPECPERPDCLPGLRRTYGLRFRAFAALDAGGPLTRQAR